MVGSKKGIIRKENIMKKNNAVLSCLGSDCPERFSLCCGAGSRSASEGEMLLGVPRFFCGKCGKEFKGGECRANKNLDVLEFLIESNLIEDEKSVEAIEDAQKAWEYAMTLKRIDTKNLLAIHRILMERLNPRIAGKIRDVDVWVGGRMGAKPSQLRTKLRKYFFEFNNPLSRSDGLEDSTKIFHVGFEEIHPFEDGNGRTGRILYNWQRLKYHLPIHVIHHGDEQWEYYKWFQKNER